ncbi:hypothetical protein [Chelativorans salis]|uniref:GIY-YIG domain-containing protein n=1 Tax=Chelativorans salis TaxID=2978478 RepID=A0ABT2LXS7_9HYPH|nr:hypothetical protein [Chelativorans sp. EGI FJ00035]MCT7378183.1 hypothetical protein [Chelativorans sp. EGI FJ00035]
MALSTLFDELLARPAIDWSHRNELSDQPGVYVFYNPEGAPVYVGRTRNDRSLKSRVSFQFSGGNENDPGTLAKNKARLDGMPFADAVTEIQSHTVRALAVLDRRQRFLLECLVTAYLQPTYGVG